MDDYRDSNFGKSVTRAIRRFTEYTDYNVIFTSCHQAFICHSSISQAYVNAIENLEWKKDQDRTFDVVNYTHSLGSNSWRRRNRISTVPHHGSGKRTLTLTLD